jgi:flagellar biogenesis protein FliO
MSAAFALAALPDAAAIPYRTDPALSGGTVWLALLSTLVLLIALVGVLLYSRRRGWLPTAPRAATGGDTSGIKVLSSRRISIHTTVHVVEYAQGTYLLTESVRGAAVSVVPLRHDDALPVQPGGVP